MILRKLEPILTASFGRNKTIILLGARQVGKTTLVKKIIAESKKNVLYLNGDLPVVRENLSNAGLELLKQIIGNATLVVIDEAQRVKNIGLTLKIMHDNFPEVQVIATGSSALELANDINEPLTGRKLQFSLFPISWSELVEEKGFLGSREQLENRLIYGMYPDILENLGNERVLLNELSESYLFKDILTFGGIRKPEILEKLIKALAFQIGHEVSYNELGRLIEVDKKTVENYINLLEKTFVIFRLEPFARNLRNEINTSRKIYFYDNGIRNAVINNFNPIALRDDIGSLWENFIISERIKANHYNGSFAKPYFWRTHSQQEIDYIEEVDNTIRAVEIKWNPKAKAKLPLSFKNAYENVSFEIVNKDNFEGFVG